MICPEKNYNLFLKKFSGDEEMKEIPKGLKQCLGFFSLLAELRNQLLTLFCVSSPTLSSAET